MTVNQLTYTKIPRVRDTRVSTLLLKPMFAVWAVIILFLIPLAGISQTRPLQKGTVQRIKVHGKGLEGNLDGDTADPYVSVYLPASYKTHPNRRYPVVYFLHGFLDDDAKWYGLTKHWINLPAILDTAFTQDPSNEMIFVTPNAYTRFGGSFYSNSVVTGNWEEFVAKELVSYVDSHYRTIPKASSRGLSGHSMGGYGAMRIGQKYPDVFSSVYLMSPGVTKLYEPYGSADNVAKMAAVKTMDDFAKTDFWTKVLFAMAVTCTPNPDNPPFYFDNPGPEGQNKNLLQAKWISNSPYAAIDQSITNYKKLRAFALDAGDKDTNIAIEIKMIHDELDKYKIKHTYEVYDGNHINHVGLRIKQRVVPFFAANLLFDQPKK